MQLRFNENFVVPGVMLRILCESLPTEFLQQFCEAGAAIPTL